MGRQEDKYVKEYGVASGRASKRESYVTFTKQAQLRNKLSNSVILKVRKSSLAHRGGTTGLS
jgi:hypothetical protein